MTTQRVEPGRAKLGDVFKGEMVQAACESKNAGYWACLTHPNDGPMDRFKNQLQKDIHISADPAAHTLVWICLDHGPEVP